MAELVLSEIKNKVCTLSMNRPEKLNALDNAMFLAIRAALEAVRDDDEVHCIVLRGEGKCFCAGHDVEAFEREGESEEVNAETVRMMAEFPKPIIVAVHSHCYTGGLELALGGDFILCSENARMGDTHSKFALLSVWGLSVRLPQRIGYARAKQMFYSAKTYTGREAEFIGLANECFPDDVFWDKVAEAAERVAANSIFSNTRMKAYINAQMMGRPPQEAYQVEASVDTFMGPDANERLKGLTKKDAEKSK